MNLLETIDKVIFWRLYYNGVANSNSSGLAELESLILVFSGVKLFSLRQNTLKMYRLRALSYRKVSSSNTPRLVKCIIDLTKVDIF